MSDQEKAALLAVWERELGYLKDAMERALQSGKFPLAWDYQCRYDGAAYMLKELELIDIEEYQARSRALFNRFMEAKYQEAVRP